MTYGAYPDLSRVQRALVVKLRHLGDVLLTTPVFSVLKRALPQVEIDAYLYREGGPLLEDHPAISSLLTYDRSRDKGLLQELRKLWQIRNKKYDLVINLTEGDRGALVARCSGASIRVGIDQRRIYTHRVKPCPSLRHTVERQLDALRRIGIFPYQEERELSFPLSQEIRRHVEQLLPWQDFFLVHPTSRWRYKCLPISLMRSLAEALIARGERLIFTSGKDPQELLMVDEIVRGLPRTACYSLAGVLSLKELGALIQRSKTLICVDSLPLHIASALKAPVLAFFGPTSEVTWGPWRNPHARILTERISCRPCYLDGCGGSKLSDCLQTFSVENIVSELELLAKIGQSRLSIIH
jgi:heptosyltransferase III